MAYSITLRLGDDDPIDLPEDNISTLDRSPWVELTDTLYFVTTGSVKILGNVTILGNTAIAKGI